MVDRTELQNKARLVESHRQHLEDFHIDLGILSADRYLNEKQNLSRLVGS